MGIEAQPADLLGTVADQRDSIQISGSSIGRSDDKWTKTHRVRESIPKEETMKTKYAVILTLVCVPVVWLTYPDSAFAEPPQLPSNPVAETLNTTNIGTTSAKLNGRVVDDGGAACEASFRVRPVGGNWYYCNWHGALHTGDTFYDDETTFEPGTTYQVQAGVRNGGGDCWANIVEFTTTSGSATPPVAETLDATNIGSTAARLNGRVEDDGGAACEVSFRIKPVDGSWYYCNWHGAFHTGDTFYDDQTGLQPGTTYYVQAGARNGGSDQWGNVVVFTTSGSISPPVAETLDATSVGTDTARLNGRVADDGGAACEVSFRIRPDGGGWYYCNWHGAYHTGESFFDDRNDLEPNTTYEFQAGVRNGGSDQWGNTKEFTTGGSSNQPPYTPANPSPNNAQIDVNVDADLYWTGGDPDGDTVYYDVYFEANDSSPDVRVSTNQTSTSYDPGTMPYETTYYWKIVAEDELGATTEGPVWHFTTEESLNQSPNAPVNPSPTNGADDVSLDTNLSCHVSDPESNPMDVTFFWDDHSVIGTIYGVGNGEVTIELEEQLDPDTTYGWYVRADDNLSTPTTSSTWHFTTTDARAWTIMAYLDGDNNLESSALLKLNGMEQVADNTDVNFLALLDRIPGWDNSNGDWTGTRRFEVMHNTNWTDLANYTTNVNMWDLGERDMGDPNTLSSFIEWALINYPAENYLLIFFDHGSGILGDGPLVPLHIGYDWTNGGAMSVPQLGDALAASTQGGDSPLNIVYLDACLMGMTEVAYEIREYADYLVANENIGWAGIVSTSIYYDDFMSSMGATTTDENLARSIVSEYFSTIGSPLCAAAMDLSELADLATDVSALANGLNDVVLASPRFQSTIQTILQEVQTLDSDGDGYTGNNSSGQRYDGDDDYIDLVDFCTLVGAEIDTVNIPALAQAVIDEAGNVVIDEVHRSGCSEWTWTPVGYVCTGRYELDACHGLSVYFPLNTIASEYADLEFASDTHWPFLLQTYIALYPDLYPYAPRNPEPADGAEGCDRDTDLAWHGGDPDPEDAVTYDIYFGTEANPPYYASTPPYPAETIELAFELPLLAGGSTYYWQIVATDSYGNVVSGDIWSFMTTGSLEAQFIRGDTNGSGEVDISDPVYSLCYQYAGGPSPACMDAADSDDSGEVNISDPVYSLNYQYSGGPQFPAPFPGRGIDPTNWDPLGCEYYPPVPGDHGPEVAEDTPAYLPGSALNLIPYLSPGEDTLLVEVETECPEELLALELTLAFDPDELEFLGLDARGMAGAEFDFLSAAVDPATSQVRLGGIPDLGLRLPLKAGRTSVVSLRFRPANSVAVPQAGIDLVNSRFVTAGMNSYEVGGGLALQSPGDLSSRAASNILRTLEFQIPSPFWANAIMKLSLPEEADVKIAIYDIHGRCIATPVNERMSAGHHELGWNGRSDQGHKLSSGIFYVRAQLGDQTLGRKVLLAR